LKSSWATKSAGTGKYSDKKKKPDGNAFVQVLDRFSLKLDKTLKKVQKSARRCATTIVIVIPIPNRKLG
jgi:hypothetical protein